MDDVSLADGSARRREAGDFLRSRRERLTPTDVGLAYGVRRRTPGLRREEVSMLAGVGITWYTFLEQGRDVHPSKEVLLALARALKLDAVERQHLLALHNYTVPNLRTSVREEIDEPLRRMLDSLAGQPAFVLGRRWDILAWNKAADVVFGPYERLTGDERNALYMTFADPDHRRCLVDWDTVARASLAMFRADCARHVGDVDFERLVARLTHLSPEFADWWPRRELARPLIGEKRVDHPAAGRMLFEYSKYGVGDSPDLKLVVFTPLDDEDTSRKLARLLRGRNVLPVLSQTCRSRIP